MNIFNDPNIQGATVGLTWSDDHCRNMGVLWDMTWPQTDDESEMFPHSHFGMELNIADLFTLSSEEEKTFLKIGKYLIADGSPNIP